MLKLWPGFKDRPKMFTQYRNLVSGFFKEYCDQILEITGAQIDEDADRLLSKVSSALDLVSDEINDGEYDVLQHDDRSECSSKHSSVTSVESKESSKISTII